jgi:hypothetical protein
MIIKEIYNINLIENYGQSLRRYISIWRRTLPIEELNVLSSENYIPKLIYRLH